MLLQEVNSTEIVIPGYDAYFQPTITHRSQGRESGRRNARGQTAIYIDKTVPHIEVIDLSRWCNDHQEVVGVRTRFSKRALLLVSVYVRPRRTGRARENWDWIYYIRSTYSSDILVIAGDFNARHQAWGYAENHYRGETLRDVMAANYMELLNNPNIPTRYGHGRQGDTTPDLTWGSRNARTDWEVHMDAMGSDHFPILVTLKNVRGKNNQKIKTQITKWDDYRNLLQEWEVLEGKTRPCDLVQRLRAAKAQATRTVNVDPDTPKPDLHLLNLWDTRIEALTRYRERGKKPWLRRRLDQATEEARQQAQNLAQERWQDLCNQFNGRMHLLQIWNMFRSWQGKSKRRTGAQMVALRLDKSEEEIATMAGTTFFPQPNEKNETCYDHGDEARTAAPNDTPFTLAELQAALDKANVRSTPGPDCVSFAELRNLPTEFKSKLLEWINDVWETGSVPDDWKESLVVPIPKPGKPPISIQNLRPISLTSNVCKLAERMVLGKILWQLETEDRFHHCQTGFRQGLSTQDNLLILYRDVLERPSKSQPRTVVAVDIQKAFDSVPHAAVIESAGLAGVGERALNFIRGFLRDRRFKVKIGDKTGPETANHVGVPQGAVLSNMVMARLPPRLSKIPQLRFALYADDIALWSVAGSVAEQEYTLQRGLDEVQRFLEEVGMTASPEKTEFVAILSGPQREAEKTRNLYTLNLAGKPIKRSSTVRVLGLFIDQDGKAGTWMARVKKESRQILHLIRRVTSRRWGTGEKETRQLVQSLFSSRIFYGAHPSMAACLVLLPACTSYSYRTD
ncbi:hypothetical protein ISCGN_022257 [Ixodes scapularis]